MTIFLLCLKVYIGKVLEVSISCFRTVLMVKGKALLTAALAVIEGLIWFLVIREALVFEAVTIYVLIFIALSYALGYATGNFIGCIVASKFTGGMVQAQVVTSSKNDAMIKELQDKGYALTILTSNATAFSGEKYMIFSEIKQAKLDDFKSLIQKLDEKAFVMVNETKYVFNGYIKK